MVSDQVHELYFSTNDILWQHRPNEAQKINEKSFSFKTLNLQSVNKEQNLSKWRDIFSELLIKKSYKSRFRKEFYPTNDLYLYMNFLKKVDMRKSPRIPNLKILYS